MQLWSGMPTGTPTGPPVGLWGVATSWLIPKLAVRPRRSSRGLETDEHKRKEIILVEGDPCPTCGCQLYWPAWQGQPPMCKLCLLDASLAALKRTGQLVHALRHGKQYEPPRQGRRYIGKWLYEPPEREGDERDLL